MRSIRVDEDIYKMIVANQKDRETQNATLKRLIKEARDRKPDVCRITETIRRTGEKMYREAYIVEGDIDRQATYVVAEAFKGLAHDLDVEFASGDDQDNQD